MNGAAHYFQVTLPGDVVILISVANLIVIVLMIVVFILAVALPFPGGRGSNQ